MRIEICNILLIPLLLQTATHRGLAADETEKIPSAKPFAIFAPFPQYPRAARERGQTGSGLAILVIDPSTGAVKEAKMTISTSYDLLDSAALNAFRVWRFRPGSPAKVRIPVTFLMSTGGGVVVTLKARRMKDVDEVLAPFLGKGTVLHAPQPTYPVRPAWTDKEGKGIYEMHVGKDGKVEDVRILKTSGDTTFDSITVSALRKWRLRRGPMIVELPLAFKLTPLTYDFWVAKR